MSKDKQINLHGPKIKEVTEVITDDMCPQCLLKGMVLPTIDLRIACPVITDADGKQHFHDTNVGYQTYGCRSNHTWRVAKEKNNCWCGWVNNVD